MRKEKNSANKALAKIPRYKYVMGGIVSIFIVCLPWISRLKLMVLSNDAISVFPNFSGVSVDFFLYYKSVFIITAAVLFICFFIGERVFPDRKIESFPLKEQSNRIILLCAGIYILAVIASTVLSKYKSLCVMGAPTECEGIFVLISYMVLLLAGINYFCYDKSIKILKTALIVLMTSIVVMMLIEFLYKPIFEIPFFQKMLAPKEFEGFITNMENKDYRGMVTLAMYNPNYFGGLCALLFPVSVTIFLSSKRLWTSFLMGFLSVGMFIAAFTAKSTAALYIVVLELVFIIICCRKSFIENKGRNLVIFLSVSVIMFSLINIASKGKLIDVMASGVVNRPSIINEKEKYILKDINMEYDTLELESNNTSLIVKVNPTNDAKVKDFKFYDGEGNELNPIIASELIKFKEEEFKNISIENKGYGIVIDIGYNDTMEFYVTEEGFKGVGQNGSVIDVIKRDKSILTKFYPFATGRGYTWINTLPILKDTLIIGTGPGTFANVFQQNDYVGLMNTHGSAKFVIDKPHNMYLQIATQTGVISLIAVIIIFIIAIRKSIKVYFSNSVSREKESFVIGFGIFIGIVGFLIISLVNDSIVTVNPIFWILLGVNFSILNVTNKKIESCL